MTPCDIVKRKVTSGGVSGEALGILKYAAATVRPAFLPSARASSRIRSKVRSEGKKRPSYQPKTLRCSKIGLLIHSVTGAAAH